MKVRLKMEVYRRFESIANLPKYEGQVPSLLLFVLIFRL